MNEKTTGKSTYPMKYPLNEYLENDFYFGEEDIQNHKQKVVKVRKPHTCCNCQKEIHKG